MVYLMIICLLLGILNLALVLMIGNFLLRMGDIIGKIRDYVEAIWDELPPPRHR